MHESALFLFDQFDKGSIELTATQEVTIEGRNIYDDDDDEAFLVISY